MAALGKEFSGCLFTYATGWPLQLFTYMYTAVILFVTLCFVFEYLMVDYNKKDLSGSFFKKHNCIHSICISSYKQQLCGNPQMMTIYDLS